MIFSTSDSSVPSYFVLLSDAKYIIPGQSISVALSCTKVSCLIIYKSNVIIVIIFYIRLQTDHTAMKGSILAPYECALKDDALELIEGFSPYETLYSNAKCQLLSIQKSYNNWFGCNAISVPVFNGNKCVQIEQCGR